MRLKTAFQKETHASHAREHALIDSCPTNLMGRGGVDSLTVSDQQPLRSLNWFVHTIPLMQSHEQHLSLHPFRDPSLKPPTLKTH